MKSRNCAIDCTTGAEAGACSRRQVEGVCICQCHQPAAVLPDPINGYPSIFPKGGKGSSKTRARKETPDARAEGRQPLP